MRKIWPLTGGVHPPDNKIQSLRQPLSAIPLPERLILPLNQHIGAPARPRVQVGQEVLKGQLIADASGNVSANVHAPTSGTVAGLDDYPLPHPSGLSATCIVIAPDGADRWVEREGIADYRELPPIALLQRIRGAGIAGLGGAGFPTAVKLSPSPDKVIKTLIINATECEPYITADHALMENFSTEIVSGIKILWHILGYPDEVLIGIEDNKPSAYKALEAALAQERGDCPIELVEFPTRYPSGGEKQIIQILTGQEVPTGKLPADLGMLCQNIGTVHAIYRAVVCGEPLISRITTVTGDAVARPGNYHVLLGTPIEHVLSHCGYDDAKCPRLIMGGPMMGFTLLDLRVPVIKTTNCLLAPSHEEMPPEPPAQPCIRCGLCAEACPVSLLPQQLFWYSQAHDYDMLESHNLFDCIECGACAYVCPSHLPLVQHYRASKGEIRHIHLEKQKADRARERFEFRQLRVEQAEAEKAAKKAARLKAAQQAKEQQSRQPTQTTPPKQAPDPGSGQERKEGIDDLIRAAQAKAAARQAAPDQQRAKLERAVAGATNRVELAREKLAAAEEGQRETLQAGLADAEHRLEQARHKLAAFDTSAVQAGESMAAQVAAKMDTSRLEQSRQKVASLRKRVSDTETRLAASDDAKVAEALQQGLDKMRAKLAEAETELQTLEAEPSTAEDAPAPVAATQDATSAAIERAKARAAAQSTLSEHDKLTDQVGSLQTRLDKARAKLEKAEAEGSDHIDALRNSVSTLEDKLARTEQALRDSATRESSS